MHSERRVADRQLGPAAQQLAVDLAPGIGGRIQIGETSGGEQVEHQPRLTTGDDGDGFGLLKRTHLQRAAFALVEVDGIATDRADPFVLRLALRRAEHREHHAARLALQQQLGALARVDADRIAPPQLAQQRLDDAHRRPRQPPLLDIVVRRPLLGQQQHTGMAGQRLSLPWQRQQPQQNPPSRVPTHAQSHQPSLARLRISD